LTSIYLSLPARSVAQTSHLYLPNCPPLVLPSLAASKTLQTPLSTMRVFLPLSLAFYAAVAFAQNNAINIPAGQSTLEVTAGKSTTITWSNPSSGTVTIKLQTAGGITPASGLVLACESATTIPSSFVFCSRSFSDNQCSGDPSIK